MQQWAVLENPGNRLTAQWKGLVRAGIAFTAWLLVNPVVHEGLQLLSSSVRAVQGWRELWRWRINLWERPYWEWGGRKCQLGFSQGKVFAQLSDHNILYYLNKVIKCLPLKAAQLWLQFNTSGGGAVTAWKMGWLQTLSFHWSCKVRGLDSFFSLQLKENRKEGEGCYQSQKLS